MRIGKRVLIRLLASAAFFQAYPIIAQASSEPKVTLLANTSYGGSATGITDFQVPSPPAMEDADYLPLIFKAFRDNDDVEAAILKSKLMGRGAQALAEWYVIRSGERLSYDRLKAFQENYKDWPASTYFNRRLEAAFLAARKPSAEVKRFFSENPPLNLGGRVAFAFALKAEGNDKEAAEKIRQIWREDTFGNDVEQKILDEFPGLLTQADHRFRMERLLFKENWGGATRAAKYAGGAYDSLVKARLGLYQGKKKAEKAFAAVPTSLRSDASYLFSRELYLRRSGKIEEAAKILSEAPQDAEQLVDGDGWWAERRYVTRELLDKNDFKTAYAVASTHGAESPAQQIEAEFHAGWIALRFMNDPAAAARHFANAASSASTPISIARGAYWQARAAEAAGDGDGAKKHYQSAASNPTTYYGQLSLKALGQPLALRSPEPMSADKRKLFDAMAPVEAANLLQQIGETDLALTLYTELAQTVADPAHLDALAALATRHAHPRAVLALGKTAVQRGFPLDQHAYPLIGIPDFERVGDPVEAAMVYAIARQESAFNPRAYSSAGARGLMQLMPATAKRTAQRFGIDYNQDRLLADAAYNAKIGSAHLGELMEDWKGSYVLAFASYNAGGGNVKKWINAYGDPRQPQVDIIDWVERIPFYETRNYVQRVMENLAVYRQRLEMKPEPDTSEYQLVSDPTEY